MQEDSKSKRFHNSGDTSTDSLRNEQAFSQNSSEVVLPLIDFAKLATATDNFSETNKIGAGGFGPVYKNEVLLISKLQHRNLVRILAYCVHGEEKLLVYEYMANGSLDTLLFDSKKSHQLPWPKRFNMIEGIARGLLYLHRDSCLRVIHRDLKASNVLLDDDMNPKISDFGLARTFQVTQELNTRRIVGTYGYMSPEYAMGGLFSEKSDIYSFGVLLLEIVNGTRNSRFYDHERHLNLLSYAWKLWTESKGLDLMDKSIFDSCSSATVLKCINIGLLCVQDHAADRPSMSSIVLMLSSHEMDLPQPNQPKFVFQTWLNSDVQSQNSIQQSFNDLTISSTEGR
ncbi:hypothetical protein KY289_016220 [Solanum tuberosum]|nr:hypothetical protein KY289_016220 [Solanum tuberosum]